MREADFDALVRKSRTMCEWFIALVEKNCPDMQLVGPRGGARGSHVSFAHPEGYPIMQALIARGIIGDFRAPDVLRFGFAPLYNNFEDVWRAAETLKSTVDTREWDAETFRTRSRVT